MLLPRLNLSVIIVTLSNVAALKHRTFGKAELFLSERFAGHTYPDEKKKIQTARKSRANDIDGE